MAFSVLPFPTAQWSTKRACRRSLSLEALEDRMVLDTVNWIRHTDGLWSTPANWSTGRLPGPADDVLINVAEAITVTADVQIVTIHSLRSEKALVIQSSPSGYFAVTTTAVVNNNLTIADQQFLLGDQLTVSGLLTWTAGNQSSIDGPGQVNANGGMAITGDGGKSLANGCTLNNAGTATWTGGYIGLFQGATWNNLSGSTLITQTTQTFGIGRLGTFNNAGTLRKATAGVTEFDATFQNAGTVDVRSGTLLLGALGNSTGAFTVGAGATLEFGGFRQTLQPGSQVSGAGDVRFSGSVTYVFGSYNVTGVTSVQGSFANVYFMADATVGQLTMTGGRLGGSGTVTVSGLLDWTNGTMAGPGRTVANGNVALRSNIPFSGPNIDGRTFDNAGVATWTGTGDPSTRLSAANGAVWNNLAGATFNAQVNLSFDDTSSGARPVFNNAGTFRKSQSIGATSVGLIFRNTGLVDVQAGTLSLGGGGDASGMFTVAAGAVLDLNAYSHAFTLSTSSQVTGAGDLQLEGGTIAGSIGISGTTRVLSGTTNFARDVTLAALSLSGGDLTGLGTVRVTGLLDWTGGRMSGPGRTVAAGSLSLRNPNANKTLDGRTLDNAGMAIWDGGTFVANYGATFNNLAGAVFDIRNDLFLSAGGQSAIYNAGTFRKSAGSGDPSMTLVLPAFYNTGTVDIQAGVLSLSGGGTSSGVFTVATMTVLEFRTNGGSTPQTLTADSRLSGQGKIRFFRGPAYILGSYDIPSTDITGGEAYFMSNARTGALTLDGNGTLGGFGDVTVTGPLTWVTGTMLGPGHTLLRGTTTISDFYTKFLDGRTIDNSGTTRWNGGNINAYNGAVWNNLAGSTFDARSDVAISNAGGLASVFNNAGTFRKSVGSGSTQIIMPFNNTGRVEVQSATLALRGGGRSTGTFSIDAGAKVTTTDATYILDTGTTITGQGMFSVNNGIPGLLVTDVVTVDNFESAYDGLIIARTARLVVNRTFNWTVGLISGLGTLDITSTAVLTISGDVRKNITGLMVNNAGMATWSGAGDIIASQNVVFNNLAGAMFDIRNNQSFILPIDDRPCSSVFNNAGTFKKTAGGGPTTFGLRFNNTGTVSIQSGTVNFTCGGKGPKFPPRPRIGEVTAVELVRPSGPDQADAIAAAIVLVNRDAASIAREYIQRPADGDAALEQHPAYTEDSYTALSGPAGETMLGHHRSKTDDTSNNLPDARAVIDFFALIDVIPVV